MTPPPGKSEQRGSFPTFDFAAKGAGIITKQQFGFYLHPAIGRARRVQNGFVDLEP
jgi:hypothetical protein